MSDVYVLCGLSLLCVKAPTGTVLTVRTAVMQPCSRAGVA